MSETTESEKREALYHVVVFDREPNIGGQLFRDIQLALDDRIKTPRDGTKIDVWIDSPGGDAHAAYKLVLELRSRCSQLQAIVPDYAKSAATLLVLGADRIYMDAAAELGPLDVQLPHPDREGVTVSGLDIADSFEFLLKSASKIVAEVSGFLVTATRLPRQAVLHEMTQFVATFLSPAVAKLDPHLIHQAAQELKVANDYGRIRLGRRNVQARDRLTSKRIDNLMKALVQSCPTHGFIIGRDQARDLGLPVLKADEYPRWQRVKEIYAKYCEFGKPLSIVLEDSELDEQNPPPAESVKNLVEK